MKLSSEIILQVTVTWRQICLIFAKKQKPLSIALEDSHRRNKKRHFNCNEIEIVLYFLFLSVAHTFDC
jgi:hypothetical protein